MAEIISAKAFSLELLSDYHTTQELGIKLIRSRDKAIVERIYAELKRKDDHNLMPIDLADVRFTCDDVLRELGGEQ